jgi:hypothetical protein
MGNWGIVLWLVGLSAITFFAVMWLLDFNNRHRQLQERLDGLFTDQEGVDLSQPIAALAARLEENVQQTRGLQAEVERLMGAVPQSVQAVGLIRFQAFSDYGGDQSFALALADAAGDGVVLSGIFAREGTRMYAKPLANWASSYSLSFEEEEAISQAQSRLQQERHSKTSES